MRRPAPTAPATQVEVFSSDAIRRVRGKAPFAANGRARFRHKFQQQRMFITGVVKLENASETPFFPDFSPDMALGRSILAELTAIRKRCRSQPAPRPPVVRFCAEIA